MQYLTAPTLLISEAPNLKSTMKPPGLTRHNLILCPDSNSFGTFTIQVSIINVDNTTTTIDMRNGTSSSPIFRPQISTPAFRRPCTIIDIADEVLSSDAYLSAQSRPSTEPLDLVNIRISQFTYFVLVSFYDQSLSENELSGISFLTLPRNHYAGIKFSRTKKVLLNETVRYSTDFTAVDRGVFPETTSNGATLRLSPLLFQEHVFREESSYTLMQLLSALFVIPSVATGLYTLLLGRLKYSPFGMLHYLAPSLVQWNQTTLEDKPLETAASLNQRLYELESLINTYLDLKMIRKKESSSWLDRSAATIYGENVV
ncbi:hypothetical protein BKA69DRAFT_1125316 [Paraphysoderma sedebokerense]|nr:hypothetical protein BKA69DRAFT_1125316 [Paraphysoderma sedebokerense]